MDIDETSDTQAYASYSGGLEIFDTYGDTSFTNQMLSLLWGPAHILSDYSTIILVVIYLRITHLFIDLILPKSSWLKDLTTILFGLIQLRNYAWQVGIDIPNLRYNPIDIMIMYYTALITIKNLQDRRTTKLHTQILFGVSIILPLLANEYYIYFLEARTLTTIRSILAGLIMRTSSIVWTTQLPKVDITANVAYLVHPASCILGVWLPIDRTHKTELEYSNTEKLVNCMQQVLYALGSLFKTIVILIVYANISDCVSLVEYTINYRVAKSALKMYLVALEFRTSHYFSGFMSETLISLWQSNSNRVKFKVCQPLHIECPRSLLEVVKFWNIPMHQWLKHHVFWPMKKRSSNIYTPLGLTYILSSMLHGFKFHIWIVLLTLGFLTWIEHQLRFRLSMRLKACILSGRCEYNSNFECSRGHRRTVYNSSLVHLINAFFTVLAMVYLAYLGYIFVGNTDQASFRDAISIWSDVYFFAHIMSVVAYLVVRLN